MLIQCNNQNQLAFTNTIHKINSKHPPETFPSPFSSYTHCFNINICLQRNSKCYFLHLLLKILFSFSKRKNCQVALFRAQVLTAQLFSLFFLNIICIRREMKRNRGDSSDSASKAKRLKAAGKSDAKKSESSSASLSKSKNSASSRSTGHSAPPAAAAEQKHTAKAALKDSHALVMNLTAKQRQNCPEIDGMLLSACCHSSCISDAISFADRSPAAFLKTFLWPLTPAEFMVNTHTHSHTGSFANLGLLVCPCVRVTEGRVAAARIRRVGSAR